VRPGDPGFNAAETLRLGHEGDVESCDLMLFPELGLSAYAIDDLFLQDALLKRVEAEIAALATASAALKPVLIVGAPVVHNGRLYNAAIAISRAGSSASSPKVSCLTIGNTTRNAGSPRGLASPVGDHARGQDSPVWRRPGVRGVDLADFVFHLEICEDFWAPQPPSAAGALAGALILCNLSASNIVVGKADDREQLCASQSMRCSAAYLYSAAGPGESTTDLAWDGQASIHELGRRLAETDRFPPPRSWRSPTSTSRSCAWSGCARRPSTTPPPPPAIRSSASAASASPTSRTSTTSA
jgi:NAD+ synthase (glutamine-hydrolysing)